MLDDMLALVNSVGLLALSHSDRHDVRTWFALRMADWAVLCCAVVDSRRQHASSRSWMCLSWDLGRRRRLKNTNKKRPKRRKKKEENKKKTVQGSIGKKKLPVRRSRLRRAEYVPTVSSEVCCVLFTWNRYLYPSTSSTPSVLPNPSSYKLWGHQTTAQRYCLVTQ